MPKSGKEYVLYVTNELFICGEIIARRIGAITQKECVLVGLTENTSLWIWLDDPAIVGLFSPE